MRIALQISIACSFLAQSQLAFAAEPTAREVSNWGQQLQQALDDKRIEQLKVAGSGFVEKNGRYTSHYELYDDAKEIRAILEPVATVLSKQKFQVTDSHNLAPFRVAFSISLPSVCPSENTHFVVDWTMPEFFYVGCAAKEFENNREARLARIRSRELDGVLRKYFPEEFVELGVVPR